MTPIIKCFKEDIDIKNLIQEYETTRIESKASFIKILKDFEHSDSVSFVKKTFTRNKKQHEVHHCNFKTNGKYTCPYFIVYNQSNSKNIFIRSHTHHNHVIDINTLRISQKDKHFIINELKSGKPIPRIIRESTYTLSSLKGSVISSDYLRNLYRSSVLEEWDKDDSTATRKLMELLSKQKKLVTYVSKFPGQIIEGLSYNKNSFLACFGFDHQIEWLKSCQLQTISVDTTYKFTKYNYFLTSFFCLDSDGRGLPFLFIISEQETAPVISYCRPKFKQNNLNIDWDNINFLMSDMASSFKNTFRESITDKFE